MGREADGEKLVADIDKQFADARSAHPEFADQTAVIISVDTTPEFYAFSSEDARGRILGSLGFKPALAVEALMNGEFYAPISTERLDLLDVDRLVVIGNPDAPRRSGTISASSNSTWPRTTVSFTSTTIRPRRSALP